MEKLLATAEPGKFIAIGECGLDYDRLQACDRASQLMAFEPHFKLTEKYRLPMYLHSRAAGEDFVNIMKANRHRFPTGVVHSYTGDLEELNALLDMGLYIGVNGCSMKTAANIEVVKAIPLEWMMVETDCPYCDIRNSHASAQHVQTYFPRTAAEKYDPKSDEFTIVKERNEPCTIV